jgi:hypothetical protein
MRSPRTGHRTTAGEQGHLGRGGKREASTAWRSIGRVALQPWNPDGATECAAASRRRELPNHEPDAEHLSFPAETASTMEPGRREAAEQLHANRASTTRSARRRKDDVALQLPLAATAGWEQENHTPPANTHFFLATKAGQERVQLHLQRPELNPSPLFGVTRRRSTPRHRLGYFLYSP